MFTLAGAQTSALRASTLNGRYLTFKWGDVFYFKIFLSLYWTICWICSFYFETVCQTDGDRNRSAHLFLYFSITSLALPSRSPGGHFPVFVIFSPSPRRTQLDVLFSRSVTETSARWKMKTADWSVWWLPLSTASNIHFTSELICEAACIILQDPEPGRGHWPDVWRRCSNTSSNLKDKTGRSSTPPKTPHERPDLNCNT